MAIDRFTHTEADAGRFARDHTTEPNDDRPTLADLNDESRWMDDMVRCRVRGCDARFHGYDTGAYTMHMATDHPGPCSRCGLRPWVGKEEATGALVCWICTGDDVLCPPYAVSPTQYRWRLHRPTDPDLPKES